MESSRRRTRKPSDRNQTALRRARYPASKDAARHTDTARGAVLDGAIMRTIRHLLVLLSLLGREHIDLTGDNVRGGVNRVTKIPDEF